MDDLVTTAEAAAMLGLGKQRVRVFVQTGRLKPALTVAGAYVFRRADVEAFAKHPRPVGSKGAALLREYLAARAS